MKTRIAKKLQSLSYTAAIGMFRPIVLIALLSAALVAQTPVPQDQGLLRVYQGLKALENTGRLMQVTAHPDDEDGGMLTFEARGNGVEVLLMTLTRGEGGQNKFGSETGDELGILRTLELLEADRFYGVEQRFSHAADFGYSKTADETLGKWGGQSAALADLVRVIREFRPDVLVARFSGTTRDGHGHHQASAILTKAAFRAAADPNAFPEQLKAGLRPWQAKKLYTGLVRPEEDWSIRLDTGEYSPILGMSYAQFALEGLSHQISQGVGGLRIPAGHRYTYYRLVDSVLPVKQGHEADLFEGIDTSLDGLGNKLQAIDALAARHVKSAAEHIHRSAQFVTPQDSTNASSELVSAADLVEDAVGRVRAAKASPEQADLSLRLQSLHSKLERSINDALGISVEATVQSGQPVFSPTGFPVAQNTFRAAVPGQQFTLAIRTVNRSSKPLSIKTARLKMPQTWTSQPLTESEKPVLAPGEDSVRSFTITVAKDSAYTRPYWHRDDQAAESTVKIDDPDSATRPFSAFPVRAELSYEIAGTVGTIQADAIAQTKRFDPLRGQLSFPLTVLPAVSIALEPATQIMPLSASEIRSVSVGVTNNSQQPLQAAVHLNAPTGWKVNPEARNVALEKEGDHQTLSFEVQPTDLKAGLYQLSAVATVDGRDYSGGFQWIGRADVGEYPFYSPARAHVSAVDVKVPKNLKVGYVMGAGDEIPAVLKQLGLETEEISSAELTSGDMSRFQTIVLGIRAFDVRNDVRVNRDRLLHFVEQGGTLVMQNNQSAAAASLLPYPATGGTERVSVETAPVEILDPTNPVFHYPNQIRASDWDGWVQERGLNFLKSWDERFTPLLAMSDPGEAPLKGGLVVAKYGKGLCIFTGLAFARQLPAGVPGAIRLFVNLVSAGHTTP